ncbi:ABC transporter ATP-binding protein [Vagococcus elongatus]|uniref:ABC-type quaternary amine transporter n=1 Tax=Vagococcus elongatus TaxID=180344 RepID=A0A430B1V8_9ENTE|nr:ABC transporter ATP-binding protein [Vagococcus elongatus]RSU14313.1 iron ABC transporter ATP-binding protein [Vagococcus elongatus]
MFLTVEQLRKDFGSKTVLHDINFTMAEGELLSILGPSGCGKSTLLRCIGGFESLSNGSIKLDGEELSSVPAEDRPVATVFQTYGLFPHMTVLNNIIYGLKFKQVSKKEAIERGRDILKLLELEGYQHKRIQELSGGEQQRVALGRSLIVKPQLLLLDEPLSNLDERLRVSMREEIKKIQQKFNIATIFVTHDQEEAFAIADRIILMESGRISQMGTAEEIYNHPASSFSLAFIGQSNVLETSGCYVRPEKIKITNQTPVNGSIVRKQFKGDTIEYRVAYEENQFLDILVLNNGENEFELYEEVYIEFEPQKIRRR